MIPIIQVGPLSLQTSGLLILISGWIGFSLVERHARFFSLSGELLSKIMFTSLIAGIVGGRILYILRYPSAFSSNLFSVFLPSPVLFDGWGGLMIGILAGLIYTQKLGLRLWSALDALSPGLAVLWIGLGAAHFASGSYFGIPSNLPWKVYLWGEYRHPTQVYEILLAIVVFGIIWHKTNAASRALRLPGDLFLTFLVLSAFSYLLIDGFRAETIWLAGAFRMSQFVAWLILAISLFALNRRISVIEAT